MPLTDHAEPACGICGNAATAQDDGISICPTCMEEREQIKEISPYSPAINRHIRFLFELDNYVGMELEEACVNHRQCLIYNGIDFDYRDPRDKKGRSNKERMADGVSPYTSDGRGARYKLHHIGQTQEGPLAELEPDEHMLPLHLMNPTEINRSGFASERRRHWRARARNK